MNSTALLLCLIAVFVSIFLNWKFNINIGVPAIVFAWIIGYWFVDLKIKDIVAGFPTSVVFQMIAITMMFSFPNQNGTLQKVADHFIYAFRKQTWALPLVIYFAGFIIGAMGAPGATGTIIVAVIGYQIADQVGMNPLIMAVASCNGSAAGSELPWSAQGVIAHGVMEQYWPDVVDSYTWKLWLGYFVLSFLMLVVTSLVLGGFKKRDAIQMEKPGKFEGKQVATLGMIVCIVLLSVVWPFLKMIAPSVKIFSKLNGFFDIQMLCVLGTLIFTLGHFGDLKQAITKGVPWNTVFMLSGMAMLIKVASAAGATDYIAQALDGDISEGIVVAALGVIGGFLSFFTGGMSVVFPMLAAMVPPIAQATGIAPYAMLISICCGARLTAISPFSTGGALTIGMCKNEKWSSYLANGCLIMAVAGMVLVAIFGVTGLFKLM